MTDNFNYYTITVEDSEGNKSILKISEDSDINEWLTIFKRMLLWMTFDQSLVDEVFSENETSSNGN